jgi:hypothetical protein
MVTSTLAPMAWRAVLDEAHAHGRFAGRIRVWRADRRVIRLLAAIDYGGGSGVWGTGHLPPREATQRQQLGRAMDLDRAGSTGRAGRSEEGKRLTYRFLMDRLRSHCSFKISRSEQLRKGEVHECLPLYHNVSKCQTNVCVPDEHRMSLTPGEVKPTHHELPGLNVKGEIRSGRDIRY